MTPLSDVIRLVDTLSEEEQRTLRDYLVGRLDDEASQPEHKRTRLDLDAIIKTFDSLREGFSEDDLNELEWAINSNYIEPADENDETSVWAQSA